MKSNMFPAILIAASLTAVSLTGCNRTEKSVANQTEAKNVKLEINDDQSQMGLAIDVQKYSFEQKSEFKKYIESRLKGVDRGIESLKASSVIGAQTGSGSVEKASDSDVKTKYSAQIQDLESDYKKVEDKVSKIGKSDYVKWEVVKSEFRDDVAALEKKYQDILTASR